MEIALHIRAKNGILQRFIGEMGWTQSEFARQIKTNIALVGRWFNMQDFPRSPLTMDRVCTLVGKSAEEIFPAFLRDPEFLAVKKKYTVFREVDLEYLPFHQLPAIEYTPDFDGFELKDRISTVLDTLKPQQRRVITLRYGLDGYQEHSLEEIAMKLKLTKERVRQIEAAAVRKLQHPTRKGMLEEFCYWDRPKEEDPE